MTADLAAPRPIRHLLSGALWILLPVVTVIASLGVGAFGVGPVQIMRICLEAIRGVPPSDQMASTLLLQVRLPRILGAMMVGAALALAGAVSQGLFKNPLASPYTLGVSNGAGFGAAIAIVATTSTALIQISALLFGLLAMGFAFLLAARGRNTTVTLVLAGLLVGSLFASLVSLVKFVADPFEKLPQIVFWLMGTLSSIGPSQLLRILPLYSIAIVLLILYRWRLNLLSMGDQEARSYGVDVRWEKVLVIVCCTVLTALCVSISGIIGWVGIVVPHLARIFSGPDYRKLLPTSLSLGACYLLIIDDVCRAFTSAEIPIGVVTGIIGTPLFIFFIFRGRVKW